MKRWIRPTALIVSLLLGILLCLINPILTWFVLAGAALAIAYWYPKILVAYGMLLLLAFFIFTWLFTTRVPPQGVPSPPPMIPRYYSAQMSIKAQYDVSRKGWGVREAFIVPKESMEKAVADLRSHKERIGETSGQLNNEQQIELIARQVDELTWRLVREQNQEPVFERLADRFVPADIPYFPLRTKLTFPLTTTVELDSGSLFVAGDGSTVELTTPRGLIITTYPSTDATSVPSGDLRSFDMNAKGFYRSIIDIEAASPLGRHEPLRSLSDFSYGSAAGWVLTGLFAFSLGLMKDRAKNVVDRFLDRGRRADASAGATDCDDTTPSSGA